MKIVEMPYVNINDGKNYFDLEIEKFKDSKQIINFFKDIMKGKKVTDKYGNSLQITNQKEKLEFVVDVKNNAFVYDLIMAKLSSTEQDLFNMILDF